MLAQLIHSPDFYKAAAAAAAPLSENDNKINNSDNQQIK